MRMRLVLPVLLLGLASATTNLRAQNEQTPQDTQSQPAPQTQPAPQAQKTPQNVKSALKPEKISKPQELVVKPAFSVTPVNVSPEKYDESQPPATSAPPPESTPTTYPINTPDSTPATYQVATPETTPAASTPDSTPAAAPVSTPVRQKTVAPALIIKSNVAPQPQQTPPPAQIAPQQETQQQAPPPAQVPPPQQQAPPPSQVAQPQQQAPLPSQVAPPPTQVAKPQKQAPPPTQAAPPTTVAHTDYASTNNWLCLPGRQDACVSDLTTSIISANGKMAREGWFNDPHAPVDCFYIYPTVSTQDADNSDLTQDLEEKATVRDQFARFTTICRPFVPMYRQHTLKALINLFNGQSLDAPMAIAYGDVLDAWHYYLDHYNEGRGVILIGHSQGASLLKRLIKEEIDGKPVQSRIISAALIGTNVEVAKDSDRGGTFAKMPICTSDEQTGCIITYSSFPANAPPQAGNLFASPHGKNTVTACTNPASLKGSTGNLHAYLVANPSQAKTKTAPHHWLKNNQPVTTPFVSLPGMLKAECMSDAISSYLAVSIIPEMNDERTGEIDGMITFQGKVLTDWGYHIIDVNLAQGNLYYLFRQQARNWQTANAANK